MPQLTREQLEQRYDAIYGGMNLSNIAQLFRADHKRVARQVRDAQIKPCRRDAGVDLYHVHEVAPHIVRSADIEKFIRNMNHADLPPLLSKEFWNGKRARQRFELDEGNLWPTEQVLALMGETFKDLKMGILLLSDHVERETSFTDRQREILKQHIDSALKRLHHDLVKKHSAEKARQAAQKREAADRTEGDEAFSDEGEDGRAADECFDDLDEEL